MATSQRYNQTTRKYSKRNYVDVLELLTPGYYTDKDITLSGTEIDPLDEIINSHIIACENISSILYISSIDNDYSYYNNLDNISGISRYFIKQNNLTNISPNDFERKILVPLGTSFKYYNTSAELESWVENTLLPSIVLNHPDEFTHEYLIQHISWLYFLNTSADGGLDYDPSSYTKDLIVKKLYRGQDVTINDGIKGFTEYLWKNYEVCSSWQNYNLIPSDFLTSSLLSLSSVYTSGTQQLEKLQTLIDVIYSPAYFDSQDTKVKDAFISYMSNGTKLGTEISKGSLHRLLTAFSYLMGDLAETVDTIGILNDIEQCPREHLKLLAELIGWKLFGYDESRWRLQLANAVGVYKRAGTKASIQMAVDSIFAEDIFSVSSNIIELYESYIPFLMYYALTTEASALQSFDIYTQELSRELGISNYSFSSIDDNIKLIVDQIIYELVTEFPEAFRLGNSTFPIDSSSFIFNYRGRDFSIPPFEEIPYYLKVDITEQMVLAIEDKLACYGVRPEFALEVGKYIRENTINAYDDVRESNDWLIFTSSMNYPPNWDSVLTNITTSKDEYLGLWSGRSSHYKLLFSASSFDFSKDTLEVDSKYAPILAAKVANEFSPAHSIQDVKLVLGETDDYTQSSVQLPIINPNIEDYNYISSIGFTGFGLSGTDMGGWKRDVSAGTQFYRDDVKSMVNTLMSTSSVITVPRNKLRRRNFKYTIPKEGYYIRDGFHMPISWDASTIEYSTPSSTGFLPLGYIPSSGMFASVPTQLESAIYKGVDLTYSKVFLTVDQGLGTNYYTHFLNHNIPDVYSKCEDLTSSSSYYGYDVSNTFPCRGLSSIGSNNKHSQFSSRKDYYVDRDQVPDIIRVIQSIEEDQVYKKYKNYVDLVLQTGGYINDLYHTSNDIRWKDLARSLANISINFMDIPLTINPTDIVYYSIFGSSYTPLANGFEFDIRDISKFINFEFGKRLHTLYKDYTKIFNRHTLADKILFYDGPTIFANAFGSIYRNSDFSKSGYLVAGNPYLIASSVVGAISNINGSGVFSQDGVDSSGTYVASSIDDLIASGTNVREYWTSGILDGIIFTQTSGTASKNSFTVFNLDKSFGLVNKENYMIANPVIKLKAVDGLPRVKFDLYKNMEEQVSPYSISRNVIIPGHDYKISIKTLACNDSGTTLGGAKLGVWIHTDNEGGYSWYWGKDNKWYRVKNTSLTKEYILSNLTHYYNYPSLPRSKDKIKNPYKCISSLLLQNNGNSPIQSFLEKEFSTFSLEFNTNNKIIYLPTEYEKGFGQLHRLTQNYIIEIFMIPESQNSDKFIILDNINVQDLTNFENTKYIIPSYNISRGIYTPCPPDTIQLTKEQIIKIFRFFNSISGAYNKIGLASRDTSNTEDFMYASGGSRLNYRCNPGWVGDLVSIVGSTFLLNDRYLVEN